MELIEAKDRNPTAVRFNGMFVIPLPVSEIGTTETTLFAAPLLANVIIMGVAITSIVGTGVSGTIQLAYNGFGASSSNPPAPTYQGAIPQHQTIVTGQTLFASPQAFTLTPSLIPGSLNSTFPVQTFFALETFPTTWQTIWPAGGSIVAQLGAAPSAPVSVYVLATPVDLHANTVFFPPNDVWIPSLTNI